MSADSPRRASRKGSTGHVILPSVVSDISIIDSLAGFIHDVVPQAYSSVLPGESREAVVWARFEQADYNDPALYPDSGDDCDATAPLLLVLGYGNGVQVWSVPASGEAVEVLSWNQRVVRILRFLPVPESQKFALRSDPFAHKRPLVAIVDNTGPGPHFCSVNFVSLHGGDQVKSIKFKNPINDVLANRRSIVTTFPEKIAIFDALTLEDRMTVTTCYLSPGINPNPVSLGSRWLAYADRRLVSLWRSQGGCEGDGAQSYTATVFHAAKSLGKGLRDLSGSVTSSLTGTGVHSNMMNGGETSTPGIVTILDIEGNGSMGDQVIAHFVAHCEPIVGLSFDPSGLLLLTIDKCGYRFHLFRIHPHPSGPSLSEVHHLYTLYRGDTSARIQDIAFSNDSRWVSVCSLRGTTHVFPITPYGGPIGVRTHTTPHVVNRLSRFHRSAGLSHEGGRNSPVGHEGPPLTPPLPPRSLPSTHVITVQPLAQLRHQAATPSAEDAMVRITACFAPPRACLPGLPPSSVPPSSKNTRRALDSLYVMACHGRLIQYDLDPRHISGVSKDRICDDTAIELGVDPKAEWILLKPPLFNPLQPPLSPSNPLLTARPESVRHSNCLTDKSYQNQDEHWLSQVEIMTHAGPHRRLWMGPQFTFKTYSLTSSDVEKESVEVGSVPVRSNPVNMPIHPHLLIESGSASSLEQSPHLTEVFENALGQGESRLREDLADAMLESPGSGPRCTGTRSVWVVGGMKRAAVVERLVNPLGTVITIDPEQACPALDPSGTSSLAPHVVKDLIIVPACSASADASSKVKQKIVKCNVEVPNSKTVKKLIKTDVNTNIIVKDSNLEKVVDSSVNDIDVVGIDKVVGKTNNKEKRKNGKRDKRSNESVEESKTEIVVRSAEKYADKPSVSDLAVPLNADEIKENTYSNKFNETDVLLDKGKTNSKKNNKQVKKFELESVINKSLGIKFTSSEQVVNANETFNDITESNIESQLNQEFEIGVKNETPVSDKWSRRSFSDCFKTVSDSFIEDKENLMDIKEKELCEIVDSAVDNTSTDSKVVSLLVNQSDVDVVETATSIAGEKDNWSTKMPPGVNKNKRKCKTLGKKMSKVVVEKEKSPPKEREISCEPSLKLDEIDLLDCPQTNEPKLHEIPDLVLSSSSLLDVSETEKGNVNKPTDDSCFVESNYADDSFKNRNEEEIQKELKSSKSQNDETTDKDSSDDSQAVTSKCDPKNPVLKKRKSSRKHRESESEILSDSDTNVNTVNVAVLNEVLEPPVVSSDFDEGNKKSVASIEVVPKMSWSRIVKMGKQDANGNFSSVDLEPSNQCDINCSNNTVTSTVEEKENNVKTSSTEDRGSVYESCSESVGEENTFEIEQQQLEIQEPVFDPIEKTNSDSKTPVSVDNTCQNTDEDFVDKSNTDSGEKESDGTQPTTKKSRKSKRKRR